MELQKEYEEQDRLKRQRFEEEQIKLENDIQREKEKKIEMKKHEREKKKKLEEFQKKTEKITCFFLACLKLYGSVDHQSFFSF
jgi:hypothetical protein